MKEAREEYLKRLSLNFNDESTPNFMGIFRCMIETAGLLFSAIYKISEVWTGPDELQEANYALRALLKGLNGADGHT